MDLSYTREQQAFRDEIEAFCAREIAPGAAARDRADSWDTKAWRALADFGYFRLYHRPEDGGLDTQADWLMRAFAEESLARACAATFLSAGASAGLCGRPIAHFGTPEQRKQWLPGLCDGSRIGCFALTEPGAGSDAAAIQTRATPTANGWRLRGEKALITNAPIADLAVVIAVTDPEAGHAGVSMFAVDTHTKGVERTSPYRKLGLRASPTGGLIFHDVELGPDALIGPLGAGFAQAMSVLEQGRIAMAHFGIGIAQAALAAATQYASRRMAFGGPIARKQAIHFKLADMRTEIDAAQLMARRAAWMADQGQNCAIEASIAKCFATEMAVRAADAALQIHGGWGYTDDFPAERLLRDARLGPIGEGSSEIQRDLIARAMLGF